MNPQPQANPPSFLSKVGNFIGDMFSSHINYARAEAPTTTPITPPIQPVATATKTQPISSIVQPTNQFKRGLETAYTLYPEVPKGLVEAVMMQESGMGTNAANKHADAGQWGWLGGITKSGVYADMLKNQNIHYKVKDVPGAMDLSTPEGTIGMITSILAQKIRQNYGGKISPQQIFELYDKYYKTQLGLKLNEKQKKQFIAYFNYYAGQ